MRASSRKRTAPENFSSLDTNLDREIRKAMRLSVAELEGPPPPPPPSSQPAKLRRCDSEPSLPSRPPPSGRVKGSSLPPAAATTLSRLELQREAALSNSSSSGDRPHDTERGRRGQGGTNGQSSGHASSSRPKSPRSPPTAQVGPKEPPHIRTFDEPKLPSRKPRAQSVAEDVDEVEPPSQEELIKSDEYEGVLENTILQCWVAQVSVQRGLGLPRFAGS